MRGLLHLLVVLCLLVPHAKVLAEELRLSGEAADARAAFNSVNARAQDIITYVTCAREPDYYEARKGFRDGAHPSQEDFLTIIAAKLHWVINENRGCSVILDVPIAERAPLDATITALQSDVNLPTRCARISYVSEVPDGARYQIDIDRACLVAQINEGIRAFAKDAVVGSSDLPCLGSSSFPFAVQTVEGEWDVPLRALTRLLWMDYGHGILEPATTDHMWRHQLSVSGGPFSSGDYPVLQLCGDERAGEVFGLPGERLDREHWSRELLRSLWDIFRWLLEYNAKMAALYALSSTGIGALPFAFAIGPAGDLAPALSFRIEETENHLLQIETSKYLINQMVLKLEPNHPERREFREEQDALREWLLKRFKTIAETDFDEYNSRPYTRYSLNAVQNLAVYAEDPTVKAAAKIVLTLSAAKFAAGSNDGRRIVPYRRLSNVDIVSTLYPTHSGSDHELARAFVYAGQTRLRGNAIDGAEAKHLIYAAIDGAATGEFPDGRFRWPIQVLETAVATKDRPPFEQHIAHDGIESYYATPAFTMVLGGMRTDPVQAFLGYTHKTDDTGAAVPSMIMPTVQGREPDTVFRILGTGSEHRRSMNLCGYHGFICGLNPRIPAATYAACLTPSDRGIAFISSKRCFPDAAKPQFYAAIMEGACDAFCGGEHRWGLIEVAWARDPVEGWDQAYEDFKLLRHVALLNAEPDDSGRGKYVTSDGHSVNYVLNAAGSYSTWADGSSTVPGVAIVIAPGSGAISAIPGIRTGDIIFEENTAEGPLIHVSSPFSATPDIVIDFRNWDNPSITP